MPYKINGKNFGVRDLKILYSIRNTSKIAPEVTKDIVNKFDDFAGHYYTREKILSLRKKGFVKVSGQKRNLIKEVKWKGDIIQRRSNRLCEAYVVTPKGKKVIAEWLKKNDLNKLNKK